MLGIQVSGYYSRVWNRYVQLEGINSLHLLCRKLTAMKNACKNTALIPNTDLTKPRISYFAT
jgi:hypothetical protein